MRRVVRVSFALLLSIQTLGIGVAAAQPAGGAVPEDKARRAAALFQEGFAFVGQSRWAEAEAKMLAAFELNPSYDIAANLGQAQVKLGKSRDAAEHLEFALRMWPVVGKQERREVALQSLTELRKVVTAVSVTVSAERAAVFVDGREVGVSPIDHEIFVDPGTHTFEAKLAGHDDAKQVVEATKGRQLKVELAPPVTPTVVMVGPPKLEIPANAEQPPERRSWVPVIALGAASVVGLGVAVGMTVASNGANDDAHAKSDALVKANEQCIRPRDAFAQLCADASRAASNAGTFGDVALGGYIASGALAIAAATYALWPRATHSSSSVRVLPDVRAGGGSIVVRAAW